MATVLHVLAHPGGGAERYIDLLERLDGYDHERIALRPSRARVRAAVLLPGRWATIAARARGVDLLHVHGDSAATFAAPLLRRRPAIITTHGLHWIRRARGAGGRLVRRGLATAIAGAWGTICTSTAERDELAALLPAEFAERLIVIPNGVDPAPPTDPAARERARDALAIGRDRLVALFVGQLESRKEPLLAVASAERASAAGVPLVLLVAGDGPLRRAVDARAGPSIRTLGFVDDLEPLYAAADIFLLPSRVEGMSIALLDAIARGVPALVANAPGNVEAVGDAGVVVEPDVRALADAIATLADPAVQARLGAAGRERVARELTADRFLAATRAVYEQAIETASG